VVVAWEGVVGVAAVVVGEVVVEVAEMVVVEEEGLEAVVLVRVEVGLVVEVGDMEAVEWEEATVVVAHLVVGSEVGVTGS
jgi:hypothetical protein